MVKLKNFNEIFDEHMEKYPDSRRVTEYMALQRKVAIKWWKAIENGDVENKDCQGFLKLFFNLEYLKSKNTRGRVK